jgi:hypothetical protein
MDGDTMGSLLIPTVANFYMEHFEQKALRTDAQKPGHWYKYADDTFMV